MLRIAICDDNINFIQELSNLLDHWPDVAQPVFYDVFDNGDALITAHRQEPYDLILLDVVMPMINGIETAREIRLLDRRVKIVFLSSSPEFALDSYSVKADDYLLKATLSDKLYPCLNDILTEIDFHAKTVTIKGSTAVYNIALHQIEYLEAQNKRIVFVLRDGSVKETSEPLHHFEEILGEKDGFFKCHRSYMINLFHIDSYTQKEIKMHSGARIPISRNSHKDFEAAYFNLYFRRAGEVR